MATIDAAIKKNISRNITSLREQSGLSQRELAQRLGVTPSRVSNWEQGANCPTIDMIFEICRVLGASINDIYGVYPDANVSLSYDEMILVKKIRSLSPSARSHVDAVLQWELEHAEAIKKALTEGSAPEGDEMSIDERVADYRRRLELEKKAEAESSVSTPAGSASTAAG